MNFDLIKQRRDEVSRELERLRELTSALTTELDELDIAARVIVRLSSESSEDHSEKSELESASRAYEGVGANVTVRQMVTEALMDARQRGVPGLAPKHIREYIQRHYGRDIGQQANTTASRMWRDIGEILKDEKTGLFSLPFKEKPASERSGQDAPAGLFSDQQQSREAETGGGT